MIDLPLTSTAPGENDSTRAKDLNALLSDEQSAIMRAESATEDHARDEQRDAARHARAMIDLTEFPRRDPHDFDATTPAQQRTIDDASEFDRFNRQITEMDRSLVVGFSEGLVSLKLYQHRARVVRQARERVEHMRLRKDCRGDQAVAANGNET